MNAWSKSALKSELDVLVKWFLLAVRFIHSDNPDETGNDGNAVDSGELVAEQGGDVDNAVMPQE